MNATSPQTPRAAGSFHPRRTAIATAVAMLASPALHAGTLPTGGIVVGGNPVATISQNGAATEMTVNQSAQSAVINWTGFSIGAGDSVQFVQPNANAVALNRVTGTQASNIAGNLSANGRVFLVNTNGVLFAGTSQVNVGGLVASALGISDADFNAGVASGRFVFNAGVAGNAPVTNSGTITAANGGTVALVGHATNTAGGSITANQGVVAMGAGPSVTLDFIGDGLTQLTVTGIPTSESAPVVNAGTLQADGGRVVMQGASQLDAASLVVNQTGVIRARSLQNRGGQIILAGGDEGAVNASGTLDASSIAATAAGGSISIDGRIVTVGNAATTISTAGSGGAANGSVAIASDANLAVSDFATPPQDSYVDTEALNGALDTSALVSLSSRGTPVDAQLAAAGNVSFTGNVAVTKTGTAAGTLQVNAARDISMQYNSSIVSTGGALDVAFNADSSGLSRTRVVGSDTIVEYGGAIALDNATRIITNGGDVAFYGQSDAVNGRATGHAIPSTDNSIAGITMVNSRIDTRGGDGSGAISMRAAGELAGARGEAGIVIAGGVLESGAGNIAIDGIGSLGHYGVLIGEGSDPIAAAPPAVLRSASGRIAITGVSPDQTNTAQTIDDATPTGVRIQNAQLQTGGDVAISGTGGDLSASYDNEVAAGAVTDGLRAGNGVELDGVQIGAGAGRNVSVTGTAGSNGLTITPGAAGNIVVNEYVAGVMQRIGEAADFGLTAGITTSGGSVLLSSANGDVRIDAGADVSSASGAGGSIVIDGDTVHLIGEDADNAPVLSANGAGDADGSVSIRSTQGLVILAQSSTGAAVEGDSNSYVGDAAINSALDSSRSVSIASSSGQINIAAGSSLLRSQGNTPASLDIDAARAVFAVQPPVAVALVPWSISSTSGALDVTITGQSSVVLEYGTIYSNGGDIAITSVNSNTGALDMMNMLIDARVGQQAANASGDIALIGQGAEAGVRISDSQVYTSTGDIVIDGRASAAAPADSPGVVIAAANEASVIRSGSGDIRVTGIGRGGDNGVTLIDSRIDSLNGSVDVAGRGSTAGVQLLQNLGFDTGISGGSGVLLTGTATGAGPGIAIDDATDVNSGGSLVLRAQSGGAGTEAVRVAATADVAATTAVNLRPGGLAADGTRFDDTAGNIVIGAGNGFVLGNALLSRLAAPNLIVGSSTHAGNIRVQAATTLDRNLTLQNTSGGITLDNSVNVGDYTLALASAGNVQQNAGGITAHSLLALSSGGAVSLNSTSNNVDADTLAGSAAGGFSYVNANAIGVGTVSANGFNAAGNAPSILSASGITAGGDVLVQTLSGNLILNAPISGANVDLVAGGVFDNAANVAVNAGNALRIWASTYTGEDRGGIVGSSNRYNCTFGGACAAGVPSSGVSYIYAFQPTLTIDIADASREYGLANPAFLYAVSGLVNGDTAATALSGAPTTAATIASNVGNYAIISGFASSQGYALNVNPGVLAITPALLSYVANTASREYGLANPLLSGTVTGFRNGDTLASATTGTLAFTSPATAGSNVGSYAINGSGLSAGNYTFTQAAGNASALQIIQATLTYVANAASREYGLDNPLFGGSVTGFRNGDTLASATSGTLSFGSSASIGSNVGNYAINGSGLSAGNYSFVQAASNASALQIVQATLTYVANAVSREYGLDNPLLGGSVTGLRNGDTLAGATSGALSFSTAATIGSDVGSYAISGGGLTAGNYQFVQAASNAGAMQITPATLLYVADSVLRALGSPNPELDGSVIGFRNGDTLGSATTGSAVFSTTAGADAPVGSYAITGSGLSAQNYVLAQAPGNAGSLSVVPVIAVPAISEVINLPVTDLYGNNFGPIAAICASSTSDPGAVGGGNDPLAHDWSLLRSKPNLASCVDTQKKNSCSAGF